MTRQGFRPPEAWRSLPGQVRRQVLRDARRGIGPADARVGGAAYAWAHWVLGRRTQVVGGTFAVLFAVTLMFVAATGHFAPPLLTPPLVWLGLFFERRQARQVLAAVASRGPVARGDSPR